MRVLYVGWSEFLIEMHYLFLVYPTMYVTAHPQFHLSPTSTAEIPILPHPDERTIAPSERIPVLLPDTNSSQPSEPSRLIRRRRFVPEGFVANEQINERCNRHCAMLAPAFYVTSRRQDLAVTSPFDWGLSGTEVEISFSASKERKNKENEISEVNTDLVIKCCLLV